jgi:hypothetical protein
VNPHFVGKTGFSHSGIARIVLQTLGFQKLTLVTHGGHEALDDVEKLDAGFVISRKTGLPSLRPLEYPSGRSWMRRVTIIPNVPSCRLRATLRSRLVHSQGLKQKR